MAKSNPNVTKPGKESKPGRAFAEEGRDAVSDNPEWIWEDLRKATPDLAEIRRSRGRPAIDNPKKQVTLRLDSDVVARFRAGGPGWQSRINEILRKAAGL